MRREVTAHVRNQHFSLRRGQVEPNDRAPLHAPHELVGSELELYDVLRREVLLQRVPVPDAVVVRADRTRALARVALLLFWSARERPERYLLRRLTPGRRGSIPHTSKL